MVCGSDLAFFELKAHLRITCPFKHTSRIFSHQFFHLILSSVINWCLFLSQVKAQIPIPFRMWLFRVRAFKELIKTKWSHKGGTLIQYKWWPFERKHQVWASLQRCLWKDTARRGWHLQAKEKPPGPTSWAWTTRIHNCDKISCYALRYPVCGCFIVKALENQPILL